MPTKLPVPTEVAVAAFTEVPVAAGVLHATMDLRQRLGELFTAADTAVRLQLGRFLPPEHPTRPSRPRS